MQLHRMLMLLLPLDCFVITLLLLIIATAPARKVITSFLKLVHVRDPAVTHESQVITLAYVITSYCDVIKVLSNYPR